MPIYDFVDWRTWKSPVLVLAGMVAFDWLYMVLCLVDGLMKPGLAEKRASLVAKQMLKDMEKIKIDEAKKKQAEAE